MSKENIAMVMKITHNKLIQNPKHWLDAKNRKFALLFLSWKKSNSSIRIGSASKALIVVIPCTVAVIWEYMGLRAKKEK